MDVRQEASSLLEANRRSGYSKRHGLEYAYTCPSPRSYPYQWFWDSCFHAVVLSQLDPEWSQRELRSLISVQRQDGFLPHVIFWQDNSPIHYWKYLQSDGLLKRRTTAYIQPPLLGLAALSVFRTTGDRAFGAEVLPAVRSYHEWLRRTRDPDGDGLISIVSPFESGLDWSPQFDSLFGQGPRQNALSRTLAPRLLDLRHWLAGHEDARMLERFDVEEILTNSIWYEAQICLAELAGELGDDRSSAEESAGADRTEEATLGKCWDPDGKAFFSLAGRSEQRLPVRTVASLMPCLLGRLSEEQLSALLADIEDPEAFGTPYPLSSVAVREASFERRPRVFLWRGPTWINTNWLAVRGLLKHGQRQVASQLASSTVAMVQQSGFREAFDAYDGAGLGAQDFGWSTLAVDMLRLASEAGSGSPDPA